MKTTELIGKLQSLVKEHGDMDSLVNEWEQGLDMDIKDVNFIPIGSAQLCLDMGKERVKELNETGYFSIS